MKIFINNEELTTEATDLQGLAKSLNLPEQGIAIAVNNQIIPRTEWNTYLLQEGASVVIIKAACGG